METYIICSNSKSKGGFPLFTYKKNVLYFNYTGSSKKCLSTIPYQHMENVNMKYTKISLNSQAVYDWANGTSNKKIRINTYFL